jgi:GNAT superfamily N-acetyltransferase
MTIQLAQTHDEIARCYPVMLHLRPTLAADAFAPRVQAQQAEGYQLAFLEADGEVVAVAGFRVQEMLATGRTLYVDDLVTDPAQRSRGYGKNLLGELERYARERGCETLSLDSGTHRQEAHAFYFRERMRVTSFHFAKKL